MKHPDHNGLPIDTDFSSFIGRKITTLQISKFWLECRSEEPEKVDISLSIEDGVIFYRSQRRGDKGKRF
jgi:hypothetical protein